MMTKSDQIAELQKEMYVLKHALQQQATALNYLKSEVNIVKENVDIIEEVLEIEA